MQDSVEIFHLALGYFDFVLRAKVSEAARAFRSIPCDVDLSLFCSNDSQVIDPANPNTLTIL